MKHNEAIKLLTAMSDGNIATPAPPRNLHSPAEGLKQIGTIQQLLCQEHQTGEAADAHDGHRATQFSSRREMLMKMPNPMAKHLEFIAVN